jgi:hypothetical protein
MIMCRMTRPSGNLHRAGVAGYTFTRTVSDLLRSRRPFLLRVAVVGSMSHSDPGPTHQRGHSDQVDFFK